MVAPGTLTEPEIDEDVSFAAKEKPIKKTDKEIKFRDAQILSMTKLVTEIPLKTLEKTQESIDLALEVLKIGNVNCVSDAAVASEMAYSAAYGAYYNVRINNLHRT